MKCQKCGSEIKDGELFCGVCGSKTNEKATAKKPLQATLSGIGTFFGKFFRRIGRLFTDRDTKIYSIVLSGSLCLFIAVCVTVLASTAISNRRSYSTEIPKDTDKVEADSTDSADTSSDVTDVIKKDTTDNAESETEKTTEGSEETDSGNATGNTGGNTGTGGATSNSSQSSNGSTGGSSGSSGSSGSGSSGNSSAYDRIHTYADAPISEYEDTSNTLPFMPMKKEGSTSGAQNQFPDRKFSDFEPGYLFEDNIAYNSSLVGYDGFVFCADSFSDYDGTSLYTDTMLKSKVSMMTKRNDELNKIGVKMYVVIIPNKNTVYSDYMPESYTMGSYRRFDQVVNAFRNAGINVIDVRESLLAAKAKDPARLLYYKTDTHWNNHGGFVAYQQIINEIKKDFPNVVVHNRSDYQINYCETFMKDQAFAQGNYDSTIEIGPVYTLKSGKTADKFKYDSRDGWGQFFYSYQWPNGYSDHLYWYRWQNSSNYDAPSLYMVRDSYSIALNTFLKDSFYKSTFNWTYDFNINEVKAADADVVIVECCEKYITNMLNHTAIVNYQIPSSHR